MSKVKEVCKTTYPIIDGVSKYRTRTVDGYLARVILHSTRFSKFFSCKDYNSDSLTKESARQWVITKMGESNV